MNGDLQVSGEEFAQVRRLVGEWLWHVQHLLTGSWMIVVWNQHMNAHSPDGDTGLVSAGCHEQHVIWGRIQGQMVSRVSLCGYPSRRQAWKSERMICMP
jgi:hypothetical protein